MKSIKNVEGYIRGTDKFTKEFFSKRNQPDLLPLNGNPSQMNDNELTVHKTIIPLDTRKKVGEGKIKNIRKEIEIRYSSIFLKPHVRMDMSISGFDRRVHDAICNLYSAGYKYLTYHSIYEYLYHSKSMNQKAIKKISESVKRIAWTWLKVDLTEEIEALGYKTKFVKINTYLIAMELLQFEEIEEKDKQQLYHFGFNVKSVIHVLSMPPMLRLWKDRNQIQTIPRNLTKDCKIPQNRWNIEIWERLLDLLAISGRYHKVEFNYVNFAAAIQLPPKKVPELPERIKSILEWFQTKQYVKQYTETKDNDGNIKGILVRMEKRKITSEI